MSVQRYDEKILNELLDKYENSLLYTGDNKRRQTIDVAINRTAFPEYFDDASMQYETIHAQLEEMEQKGFITLVWKNKKVGHILEKCVLCPEKVREIYAFLNRIPKEEKERAILQICDAFAGRHPVIDNFLSWVRARIFERKSVKLYLDLEQPQEFRMRLQLLYEILTNEEEVFWREFSVRFWNDSKIAEKELSTAASIIAHFSGETDAFTWKMEALETEQILEEFGIYKNPSWVMMKGCGRFCISKTTHTGISHDRFTKEECEESITKEWVCLKNFSGGIGLSSEDISNICWDPSQLPEQIVTIENLTSFHRFVRPNTLIIYLGGYPNRAKRRFLMDLYESYHSCNSRSTDNNGDTDSNNSNSDSNNSDNDSNNGNSDSDNSSNNGSNNSDSNNSDSDSDNSSNNGSNNSNRNNSTSRVVIFEHFGDLDCGGFQIWRDLRDKTGIPFRTLYMDEETYLSHLQYGKTLTVNDRTRLEHMIADPYFAEQKSLFSQMLKKGRKIEQECVRSWKESSLC